MKTNISTITLIQIFGKLGIIGFGGPAAHIAMMEREFVQEREWIEEQKFLDLVGATNLIPGPNSTEMAIHLGYLFAGKRGLLIGGLSFLFPAIALTLFLAILYVQFGSIPAVAALLVGIKPVVIIIIAAALWKLGKKASKHIYLQIIGVAVAVLVLIGVNPIIALLGGGIVGMFVGKYLNVGEVIPSTDEINIKRPLFVGLVIWAFFGLSWLILTAVSTYEIWDIGLFFYTIGSILYGSGYVLIAFLEEGVVNQRGWLTIDQLLDAVAIGQFTPGPVLSTSTFIGFLIAGIGGAIVATLGIFTPSFIFVTILSPMIPKMRQSELLANFLDSINAAALGLMIAVVLELLIVVITTWGALLLVVLATIAVFKYKVSSVWIVLGGALLGILLDQLDLFIPIF